MEQCKEFEHGKQFEDGKQFEHSKIYKLSTNYDQFYSVTPILRTPNTITFRLMVRPIVINKFKIWEFETEIMNLDDEYVSFVLNGTIFECSAKDITTRCI